MNRTTTIQDRGTPSAAPQSGFRLLPAVIALYYIIHAVCYARALEFSSLPDILGCAALTLVYCYALHFSIYRPGRPLTLTLAPLVTIFTLFYGTIRNQLYSVAWVTAFVRQHLWDKHNLVALVLFAGGSALLLRLLAGSPQRVYAAARSFMVFFAILALMDIGSYYQDRHAAQLHPIIVPAPMTFAGDKPDVYLLIFDSQTSPASLEKYWGYRSDTLTTALRERGLFVEEDGRSNYNWTPYSMTSILNMSYLRERTPVPTHTELPSSLTAGVIRTFTDNGYSFVNLSFFNVNSVPALRSIIQYSLWEPTVFYYLYDRYTNYAYRDFCSNQRTMFHLTADSLSAVIERTTSGPKFVYAHFYVPHTPAFIDRDGSDYASSTRNVQDMDGYLRQAIFSYGMIGRLVDRILLKSSGRAIILIQGDHGYRYLEGPRKFDEEFCAFKAYYFPDRNYRLLAARTSSVNTFRIVLNTEFGASLPLLPDTSFDILLNTLRTLR